MRRCKLSAVTYINLPKDFFCFQGTANGYITHSIKE
nr:MAG TPA: hypothetical protein [Caudoviricetes sp.]